MARTPVGYEATGRRRHACESLAETPRQRSHLKEWDRPRGLKGESGSQHAR